MLLSLRWLTFIGLLSYSAYLWHWPVLAFLRYGAVELNMFVAPICLMIILSLAWGSYKYVEVPCRKSRLPFTGVLLRQMLLPSAVVGMCCLVFMKMDGYGLHIFNYNYQAAL